MKKLGKHTREYSNEKCAVRKLRRRSFITDGAIRATQPLELIHSDVVGKIELTSMGGSNYFVTFIDNYFRHTEAFPIKKKSDVLQRFDEFKQKAKNILRTKIIIIRSDNGGEYKNAEVNKYLKANPIQRQMMVPGTSQQNGVAKRMNQGRNDEISIIRIRTT